MLEKDKKIALVTGASRGIGKEIARNLVMVHGLTVVGTATTDAGAQSITDYLHELGCEHGFGLKLDVTDDQSVSAALEIIEERVGEPLILINNAGLTCDNLLMRLKIEDWQKVIDANLTGVFRITKACIRGMIKARWGRVVNISSVVAVSGNAGQVNYCASKAGVIGFAKALAQEIASRNITVNVVAPGFIATDMTGELNEAQQTSLLARIPMGRMGQADDIASAVSFLVSDSANYITGETLHVNGGMLMS
jgi:3-oxoacyl-[acyl-carrier protein] reductase